MKWIRILFFLLILLSNKLVSSGVYIHATRKPDVDKEYSMQFEGRTRTYIVHIPQTFKDGPIPLLFCLHGGGGTGKGLISLTFGRFNELSDSDGFIVVYPNAVEKNWNDGRMDKEAKSTKENINDVGFILAIIDELVKKYNIDKTKIFSCGISNGGFMSCRLACDKSEVFSGVGILTATMGVDYYPKCNPSKPLKVIIFNGTEDPLVPYNGGNIEVFNKNRGKCISTDCLVDFWRKKNNCDNSPSIIKFLDKDPTDGTTVEKYTYTGCKGNSSLVLFKITGGGHSWPGGKQYLGKKIIGNTCKDINACDEMWNFFKSGK
jgi:polyhydroxybutyrate depolymerase